MDAGRVAPPASLVPGARPGAGRGSAAAHGRRGRWGRRAPLRCAAPGTASLRPPPGAGRRAGDNSGRQHACSRPRPPRPAALNPYTAAARRCARCRRGTRSRHRTDERALPRGTQPAPHATHTSCPVAGLRPPSGLCGQSRSGEAGPARGPSSSGRGTPSGSTGLAAPVHRAGGGWGGAWGWGTAGLHLPAVPARRPIVRRRCAGSTEAAQDGGALEQRECGGGVPRRPGRGARGLLHHRAAGAAPGRPVTSGAGGGPGPGGLGGPAGPFGGDGRG